MIQGIEFPVEDSEYADYTAVLFESRENLTEYSPLLVENFDLFGMEIHKGNLEDPDKPPNKRKFSSFLLPRSHTKMLLLSMTQISQ